MARGSTVVRALTGALVVMTAAASGWAAVWVKDPQSGCATSNPFPNPNESIKWFGNCRDGKLDGRGTLVWYRDGNETERNEGYFKDGELDGYAATKYPEGYVVHGQYKQGQRHGQFMTIRGDDYIRATYYNGALVSQARLSPEEVADWTRRGGPLLVANAPPPADPAKGATKPGATKPTSQQTAAAEPPITGRTAVASPSRQLAPPPKPAEAPSKPLAQAAPAAGKGNYVLGTQVAEAIQQPAAAAATTAATAARSTAAAATAGAAVAAPAAIAAPVAAPVAMPAAPPPAPARTQTAAADGRDPAGIYLAAPSLTSPPLPGGGKVKQAPQPADAGAVAAQASRYQIAVPQSPAPSLPGTLPTAGSIASPSLPGLPSVATAPIAAGGAQAPAATNLRRPPWMAPGSPDPVLVAGVAVPGQTPPPLPPTPMAGAAPLAGPAQPYVPPVYAPPPLDYSPTAASRQYLALREGAQAAQMNALPSYRALQSAAPQGGQPLDPAGAVMPGQAMHASGSAEQMFQQAYKLEMSGRFREAEQTYERIILSLPNTQTAMLANERLNGIRRNTRDLGVRIADQRQPQQPERQSQVVAVNEPRNLPRYAQPTGSQPQQLGDSGAGDAGGGMLANLTGLSVCSQRGLYDRDSRWCGMVLADDGARLSVEIRDVLLPGFGNIGIGSSKCSGGTFINWFSKGSMVRVPRSCMELKG